MSLGVCGGAFLTNADFQVVSRAQAVIDSADSVAKLEATDYRIVSDVEKSKAETAFQKAKLALAEISDAKFETAYGIGVAGEVAKDAKQAASKRLGSSSIMFC